jgi:hypothetical protein
MSQSRCDIIGIDKYLIIVATRPTRRKGRGVGVHPIALLHVSIGRNEGGTAYTVKSDKLSRR